jgi:hypothetical protein
MTDANRLVAMLDVRIRDFERKMQQAQRVTQRKTREISREFERANRTSSAQLTALARNLAMGLAGGLVAGAFTALTTNLRQTVRGIAEVGDAARRSGLGIEEFQRWNYVAQQNRIGIDQLVDGFKELNLRADEFIVTGGGSAAEAFNRLGFTADQLGRAIEDPSELMLEIVRRLQNFDRAAQIRIADEVFGGSAGERFVELLAQGDDGLRQTLERAREVGAVIETEMIQRAALLDQKFTDIGHAIADIARSIAAAALGIETPAERLERIFGSLERARAELGDGRFEALIRGMGELQNLDGVPELLGRIVVISDRLQLQVRATASGMADLTSQLSDLGMTTEALQVDQLASDMEALVLQLRAGEISGEEFEEQLAEALGEAESLFRQMASIDGIDLSGVNGQIAALISNLATAAARASGLRSALPGGAPGPGGVPRMMGRLRGLPRDPIGVGHLAPTIPVRPRAAPPLLGEPGSGGGGGGGGGGGRDIGEYQREIAAIRERTAAIEAEAAVLATAVAGGREYGEAARYAAEYVRLMTAAQREGVAITPQLTAEIEAAAAAYASAAESADRAAESMRNAQEQSKAGANAMADLFGAMVQGGDAARQALARLLTQIAQVQMQRAMMGFAGGKGGGFFGFLGSLLSLDSGGFTGEGGTHEAKGIVHGGEYVFSKKAVNKIGVGNLEALHRNVQGFAKGGFVGAGIGSAPGAGGRIEVAFRAVVDGDGNLRPFVEQVSGRIAGREVRRATPEIMAQSAALVREQAREFPLP